MRLINGLYKMRFSRVNSFYKGMVIVVLITISVPTKLARTGPS